jgi:cytoskeletal protein CcmA (bactofilin family)
MTDLREESINIIAIETRIEGKVLFDKTTRVHGTLVGEIKSKPGSTLIIAESASVDGNIHGDTVFIDGFVRGDIDARTRVVVSGTGRVLGNITAPSVAIDFGGYFEGKCLMENRARLASSNP